MPTKLHRYYDAGHLHFITTNCFEEALRWAPHRILIYFSKSWNRCRHYVAGEPRPVLVNEVRKAELHVRQIA
jgi:hypothetical protein